MAAMTAAGLDLSDDGFGRMWLPLRGVPFLAGHRGATGGRT